MFPQSVFVGLIVASLAMTSLSVVVLLGLLLSDYLKKRLW